MNGIVTVRQQRPDSVSHPDHAVGSAREAIVRENTLRVFSQL